MSQLRIKDATKGGSGVTLGASETDTVISEEVALTAQGCYLLRAEFEASSVTSTTGITVNLQHKLAGTWTDVTGADGQVAVTTDTGYGIKVSPYPTGTGGTNTNATYATFINDLPLSTSVRLVATTGTGDAATFTKVRFQQG